MSNGYGGYQVVNAEELERRRLAAAQARYDRACQEAAELQQAIAAARKAYGQLGVQAPKAVRIKSRGSADVEQAAIATEAATARAWDSLDTAVGAARAAAMAAEISTVRPPGLPELSEAELKRRQKERRRARQANEAAAAEAQCQAAASEATSDWAARDGERRAEVARVAGRLPADTAPPTVADADRAAHRALIATSPAEYDAAIMDLRATVQVAHQAHERRRQARQAWERLRAELDGLDPQATPASDETAALLAELARQEAANPESPPPPHLASRVRAAVAATRAESDRTFALDAVVGALADLGYQVDDGFSTSVASGGGIVPLPWSGDYGVQVRERGGHLLFNVIRYQGDPDAVADVVADERAEQRFCDDYGDLVEAAGRRGVELYLARSDPAGLQPLQQIRPPRDRDAGRAGHTRSEPSRAQERKR